MNRKIHLAAICVFALAVACGTEGTNSASIPGVDRTVEEVTIAEGEPTTKADLSIEGMSCEMMCGGSIKKALAALGVEGTEIKMNEGEGPDHAIVTYDVSKITDAQLVEAVQKLHDGQYKVIAVHVTQEVKSAAAANDAVDAGKEEHGVSVMDAKEVVLPSILAVLSRILRP